MLRDFSKIEQGDRVIVREGEFRSTQGVVETVLDDLAEVTIEFIGQRDGQFKRMSLMYRHEQLLVMSKRPKRQDVAGELSRLMNGAGDIEQLIRVAQGVP
jgi:ribosomal protein L24